MAEAFSPAVLVAAGAAGKDYQVRTQEPRDRARVAVVVPMYRERLTFEERISLRHLQTYLSGYPRFALKPRNLSLTPDGFETLSVAPRYFGSRKAYSALLLSQGFYREFEDYDYILIHQLDALVFRDELAQWCSRGFDYVGAPWIAGLRGNHLGREGVGNGGLSLRRVSTFQTVLRACRLRERGLWPEFREMARFGKRALSPERATNGYAWARGLRDRCLRWFRPQACFEYEDVFWAFEAKRYFPSFSIPDVDTALQFAFELEPQRCFQRNGGKLPFGCHAWSRYDPGFWRPHLLDPRGCESGASLVL